MQRFRGKTVLVTGGGRGIGRATCLRLAEEGAAVAVLDIDKAPADEVVAAIVATGRTGLALAGDISDAGIAPRMVEMAEKALGPLDVLVNNAAEGSPGRLDSTNDTEWAYTFGTTLHAAFAFIMAATPSMVERGRGAIVNVASVNGLMTFGNPAYSSAKAGLMQLTRTVATEFGPKGVRCNTVSPGTIKTEHPSWQARVAQDPQVFEKLARYYPVGRVGKPEDIAAAIAYLAADEAAFVNGANLVVDGGLTAGMAPMIADLMPGDQ